MVPHLLSHHEWNEWGNAWAPAESWGTTSDEVNYKNMCRVDAIKSI